MAFVRFVEQKNEKTEKVSRPGATPVNEDTVGKGAFVTIQLTGKDNYFLSFNRNAVEQFGLEPGDLIHVSFDAETNRVGFRKRKKGDYRLVMHGGIPDRLKVSITKFFRMHLATTGIVLPFKAYVERGEEGWIVFPVADAPRRGRGRPRKLVEI